MNDDKSERNTHLTRRRFLKSAAAGGATMAAASPLAQAELPTETTATGGPKDPLEALVERYGSEFGELRKPQ